MSLYLVQHGKNNPKDMDPDKNLSEEGRADVSRIAKTAQGYGVPVKKIRHSGKPRAQQTAVIFAEALSVSDVEAAEGLGPTDDVTVFAKTLDSNQNLMLVGHLPFMEKMASYLTAGSTDLTVFKFQNGGVVCLDKQADSDAWSVTWALMPRIG